MLNPKLKLRKACSVIPIKDCGFALANFMICIVKHLSKTGLHPLNIYTENTCLAKKEVNTLYELKTNFKKSNMIQCGKKVKLVKTNTELAVETQALFLKYTRN